MQAHKSREPFGFGNEKVTIVSYVPKLRKAIILLSTMHHVINVSSSKKKPEIITY